MPTTENDNRKTHSQKPEVIWTDQYSRQISST